MTIDGITCKRRNICGMELFVYEADHVEVVIAEGDENGRKWATIYQVECEPEFRNQGRTQAILSVLKRKYETHGYTFGCTVALNPTMKHILTKLKIKEYE